MSEPVAIRSRYADGDERTHVVEVDEWPLPERFEHADGAFVKVAESQLTEPVPGVIRGAQYVWEATDAR